MNISGWIDENLSDSGPESSEFSSDDEESGLFSLSDHPPTSEELNFTLSEVDMKNHALQIQNAKTHYRVSTECTYNNLDYASTGNRRESYF